MFFYGLLLWGLSLSIFVFFFYVDISKEDKYIKYFGQGVSIVNMFLTLFFTIELINLYSSPHYHLNTTESQIISTELLDCVKFHMPKLTSKWEKIDKCLHYSEVYNLNNGRMPLLRVKPTAFILNIDKKSIFVSPEYRLLNPTTKSLILIHECAHLALGAKDHAYRWEQKFKNLTNEQHYENADSFYDAVMHYCVY
jgi:hypothetical protein